EFRQLQPPLRIPSDWNRCVRGSAYGEAELLVGNQQRQRDGLLLLLLLVGIGGPAAVRYLKPTNLSPHRGHDEEADGDRHQVDERHQIDGGVKRLSIALAARPEIHAAGHVSPFRSSDGLGYLLFVASCRNMQILELVLVRND